MSEWKLVIVGDIAKDMAMGPFGSDIKSSNFVENGVPVIRGGNLGGNKFHDDDFVFLTDEKADSLKRSNAYPNDIIFTHRGTLGQVAIIPTNSKYPRYVVSQSQMRLTCNIDIVNPKYVYYYFLSPLGQNELLKNTSTTGVPAISQPLSSLKKMTMPLPPLSVQTKIVDVLSSLDNKIELNNHTNKTLEEIAQTLFKRWFIDFEFLNEEGNPYKSSGGKMVESKMGMIPEGWYVKSVGDLCSSISKTHTFKKEEIIFLNTGDIENGVTLHNNYSSVDSLPGQAKKSIQHGDILYSEIRPINRHFALIDFDAEDYVVSTKLMVLRCKNINNQRLYHYLTTDEVINDLQAEAESRSGTFPQIRFENIKNLNIVLGTDDIEEKFSQILKSIYALINENISEIKRLSEMRDTLLPKLMNGKLMD